MNQKITKKTVGDSHQIFFHAVENMEVGHKLAYALCKQYRLPIYYGTGYPINKARICFYNEGDEINILIKENANDEKEEIHFFYTENQK